VTLVSSEPSEAGGFMLGQQLVRDERVTVLTPATVAEITGDTADSGLLVIARDGSAQHIGADGVFIEWGLDVPSGFLGALVERVSTGQVIVNDRCATHCAGLFAAGDITSTAYAEQILIALDEGTKAGISACAYVCEGPVLHEYEHIYSIRQSD
jgi:alkyl hydroperoxide reductase subunit AhpF